ncbi:SETMR methyltransferase, partial [Acromyrmex heyeri]
MKKKEFRAVIKHIHLNEFKRGRTSTCDSSRSGRSIEASTPEIIDKIHGIVLTDRRVKVREFVEATGISHGTVISILHEQLGMKKLSARWVPRLFTVDHKRDRVTISKQCLKMFQRNPDEFCRFITVDEIWIHYFTSMSPSELGTFQQHFKEKKRPHLAKKKVLFHQDNARIHMCPAPMAKFNEFRYELLPAYSPDLAPCDYFLFPNLKKWRKEIAETDVYLEELDKSYYSDDLKKLENRWNQVYRDERRLC